MSLTSDLNTIFGKSAINLTPAAISLIAASPTLGLWIHNFAQQVPTIYPVIRLGEGEFVYEGHDRPGISINLGDVARMENGSPYQFVKNFAHELGHYMHGAEAEAVYGSIWNDSSTDANLCHFAGIPQGFQVS